jgi:hypothetical protein
MLGVACLISDLPAGTDLAVRTSVLGRSSVWTTPPTGWLDSSDRPRCCEDDWNPLRLRVSTLGRPQHVVALLPRPSSSMKVQ